MPVAPALPSAWRLCVRCRSFASGARVALLLIKAVGRRRRTRHERGWAIARRGGRMPRGGGGTRLLPPLREASACWMTVVSSLALRSYASPLSVRPGSFRFHGSADSDQSGSGFAAGSAATFSAPRARPLRGRLCLHGPLADELEQHALRRCICSVVEWVAPGTVLAFERCAGLGQHDDELALAALRGEVQRSDAFVSER